MGQRGEPEMFFKSHATFLFLFQLFSLVPTFGLLGNRIKKCCLIASFLNTVRIQWPHTNKAVFHVTKLSNSCLGF